MSHYSEPRRCQHQPSTDDDSSRSVVDEGRSTSLPLPTICVSRAWSPRRWLTSASYLTATLARYGHCSTSTPQCAALQSVTTRLHRSTMTSIADVRRKQGNWRLHTEQRTLNVMKLNGGLIPINSVDCSRRSLLITRGPQQALVI